MAYEFEVTMVLQNLTNSDLTVSIPRGMLIEPKASHMTVQSAVIMHDYIFVLNPKETRSVILKAECWNEHLSPPKKAGGKLTPLKGDVMTSTNMWNTSATPHKATISASPSQPADIFSAFATTSPELAYDFLKQIAYEAEMAGENVSQVKSGLAAIASSKKSSFQLQKFAQRSVLKPYLTARELKNFFIKKGGLNPSKDYIVALINLITDVHIFSTHTLSNSLVNGAGELGQLAERRDYSLPGNEKDTLTNLTRQKYLDLLNGLTLLDKIDWNPGQYSVGGVRS
jgi:hypothetical protein